MINKLEHQTILDAWEGKKNKQKEICFLKKRE